MSWARIKATGSGALSWRLVIAGCPYTWCSSAAQETTEADGRLRICALETSGVQLGCDADIARASVKAKGFNVTIVDVGGYATRAFSYSTPTKCWLTSDLSLTETATITVSDTSLFPFIGTIHIGTEAISYIGTTGNSFSTLTRGYWNTPVQKHFTENGRALRRPEITDAPASYEGRRAYLYAYGEGDSPTGPGTQVAVGIMSREPRLDGPAWSLSFDPITRLLDTSMGDDLEDAVTPRGIYYPWTSALRIMVKECATATFAAQEWTSADVTYLTGFYETQADFVRALNVKLASYDSGFFGGGQVRAIVDDVAGWRITYTTGGTARHMGIWIESQIDNAHGQVFGSSASPLVSTLDFAGAGAAPVATVTTNTVYYARADVSPSFSGQLVKVLFPSRVPRGLFSTASVFDGRYSAGFVAGAPPERIYLGGDLSVGSLLAVDIEDGDATASATVNAQSSSSRYIEIRRSEAVIPSFFSGPDLPKIKSLRNLIPSIDGGNVADFIEALINQSPDVVNSGALPLITDSDIQCTGSAPSASVGTAGDLTTIRGRVLAAAGGRPWATARAYLARGKTKLRDLLENELRLIGCYMALASDGRITVRDLRLLGPSETTQGTIDASSELTGVELSQWERQAFGSITGVELKTRFDPGEGKHLGPSIVAIDATSRSRAPNAMILEIAPRTNAQGEGFLNNGLSRDDVLRLAAPITGLWGRPYAIATVTVPLTLFDVLVGDSVTLTSANLPNQDTGARGVSSAVCLVTAASWRPNAGFGTLTLLLPTADFRGYTPTARVVSQVNVSGNTWDITMSASPPAGHALASRFVAGDRVVVVRWNNTTPGPVSGTVSSVAGAVIRVVFGAVWTPGADTWNLEYDLADSGLQAAQKLFAYIADTNFMVDDGGSGYAARSFSP